MADPITDVANVKAAADGLAEWMPLIQTLSGAVLAGSVAIGVSWLNHFFAREREEKAMAGRLHQEHIAKQEKREREVLFIAIELVFLLEQFAEGCARVATDEGYIDAQGYTRAAEKTPEFSLDGVTGDWRVLPARLMYSVRELPLLCNDAQRRIAGTEDYDDPPDYPQTAAERHYQYARLGIKALIMSQRLRILADLKQIHWSAQPVLWNVWRQERHRRATLYILQQRELAAFYVHKKLQTPPVPDMEV